MPPGLFGGWDPIRVDEGLTVGGVREVLHAVVADALGEPRGLADCCFGLRFAPVNPGGSRSLHALDGLLPHRVGLTAVDPRWSSSPDASGSGKCADAVRPHALGELHRLVLTRRPARPPASAGGAGLGRCVRATARADQGDQRQGRPAAESSAHVTAASLDRGSGRRTWAGSRDRRLRGAVRSARVRCRRSGTARTRRRARTATPRLGGPDVDRVPRHVSRRVGGGHPAGGFLLLSRTSRSPHGGVAPGTPGNASRCRRRTRPRRPRHRSRPGAGHRAELDRAWRRPEPRRRRPSCRRGRHRRPRRAHHGARCGERRRSAASDAAARGRGRRRGRGRQRLVAEGCGDRRDDDEQAGDTDPANPNPTGRCSCWFAVGHAAIEGSAALPARMRFSIRRRYAPARSIGACAC